MSFQVHQDAILWQDIIKMGSAAGLLKTTFATNVPLAYGKKEPQSS